MVTTESQEILPLKTNLYDFVEQERDGFSVETWCIQYLE